jgi:hypothetical protein
MPSGDGSDGEEDESEEMDGGDAAPMAGEEDKMEDSLQGRSDSSGVCVRVKINLG